MILSEEQFSELSKYCNLLIDKDFFNGLLSCVFPENFDLSLVTVENLKIFLASNGVVDGYINENIEKIEEVAKNGGRYIDFIKIAKYTPPQNETAAVIKWYVGPYSESAKKEISDETTDLRNLNKIFITITDEIICIKYNATKGIPGKMITGKIINALNGSDHNMEYNYGIITEEFPDKIIYKASIDGHLKINNNKFWVEDELKIDGDVNYSTGNINYINNVVISGNVISGFNVQSSKNITIKGFVEDGARITAEGDIEIHNGIIGENTVVKAGQYIIAGYVHHARLHSEDTIIINRFVLHADIYAKNKIEVRGENLKADTSAVIASTLSSDSIIKVQSVGTDLAGRSHLKICDLFEKLSEIDLKTKDLRHKLTKILRSSKIDIDLTIFIEFLKTIPEDKQTLYKLLFEQIQCIIAAVGKNNAEKKKIRHLFFMKMLNAEIEIYKDMIPPVTIIFFDKTLKIDSKKSTVKFIYDQNTKNIVVKEKVL